MSRVVFLLEEYSAKVLLDGLLPRLFPGLSFLCVPHEGKQDLEKSIPRKLKAWREPGVRFVVLRDNDGADCRVLKRNLAALCESAGRPATLVRVACQEVEAWYLGDLGALASGYDADRLRRLEDKERFRDPDSVVQPAKAIMDIVPAFQKVSGARRMATLLGRKGNRSASYKAFVEGVAKIARALEAHRGAPDRR
jgi:hypothetical protein